jgi:diacylglycerol O-acyltransferase / trehalose O-mycolyltransferase
VSRRPTGTGRAAALVLALVAALLAGGGTAVADPASGAHVVSRVQRGGEIHLRVFSPAMGATLPVTLLLPRTWATPGPVPTLYALSGIDETDDTAWIKQTDLPAFAAVHDALVVLVPTSKGGMFSDWFAPGPRWETFDTVELPALIRSQFRGGPRQAVMGISVGGHAALKFAEHQPGAWAAAASFSGIPFSSAPGISALYEKSMADAGVDPRAPWGDPVAQSAVWAAQDPASAVANLRGTAVFLSASSGVPDPGRGLGALPRGAGGTSIESVAFTTSAQFAQQARAAGVAVTSDFAPTGTHDWPLWNDEYKKAWPTIAAALGIPT